MIHNANHCRSQVDGKEGVVSFRNRRHPAVYPGRWLYGTSASPAKSNPACRSFPISSTSLATGYCPPP